MIYDPYTTRNRAFEPDMLNFYLGTEFEAHHPMGNVAISRVATVAKAWLVGLHEEVAPILPKVMPWLDEAIAKGEDFGGDVNVHQRCLREARALAGWLLDGSDCADMWQQALVAARASWLTDGGVWPDATVRQWGLDSALAYALQSGSAHHGVETAIELYERYTGQQKAPNLKTLRRPRDWAYALALHTVGRQAYEPAALLAAGRRVLSLNLQENWLGEGHTLHGAMWLKLVYSLHQPALTPRQTILRAYDNMPDVPWPDFLPR